MKLTFKKYKETGLSAIGAGTYIEIKHKRKRFGIISGKSWRAEKLTIQIAVKDGERWKWIFLSDKFENEEDARKFIQENIVEFVSKYQLHYLED